MVLIDLVCRAIGAVVARFVHTEEVTGSNPVSPTPHVSRSAGRYRGSGRTVVPLVGVVSPRKVSEQLVYPAVEGRSDVRVQVERGRRAGVPMSR
jgi:hypothetical protein